MQCYSLLLIFLDVVRMSTSKEEDLRIIGGRYARRGEFPHAVLISFRPHSSSCGGGILSPLYVLTACHCTVTISDPSTYGGIFQKKSGDYSNTRVVAGTLTRDPPHDQGYQLRWVFRWMQHPQCEFLFTGEWLFDTAIIQVAARFFFNELVQPIPIPAIPYELFAAVKLYQVVQRTCHVAGWGFTAARRSDSRNAHYSNPSKYLKTLLLRLMPPYYCNLLLCEYSRYRNCIENYTLETPDRLCAKSVRLTEHARDGSVCGGDSGSTLICGGLAVGTVSYTSGCISHKDPVVYSRIDKALNFISKYYINSPDYVGE